MKDKEPTEELVVVDVQRYKKVKNALQDSEARYRSLFENVPIGIFRCSADGKILDANPALQKILGYAASAELEQKNRGKKDKNLLKILSEFCAKIESQNEFRSFDLSWRKKDKPPLFIRVNARMVSASDNKVLFYEGTVKDISERKQAESALRESEERYRILFENNSAAMAIIEPDTTISMVNEEYCKMSGYTKQEVVGMSWTQQIPPEDLERLKEFNRRRLINSNDAPDKYEFSFYNKNGEIKHALMSVAMIQNKKIITSFIDITGRKRAESQREAALEALKENTYLLKEAQKVAHIGHWELDPKIGKPTWSEEIFHIFGLDPKKDEPSFVDHETHLHPDDWPILNMAVTKTSADGSPFDIQFRIVQPGGEIRWMHALGTAKMAANGVVSKLFGTAQDITARKQAEDEVKRQLAEKEILLKEVHHRINNNIASIGGLISLHMQSVSNPEAVAVLQEAIGRVNSMRILYDKLLITDDYRDISVKNYVESLADAVLALFQDRAKIKLKKQIADFQLDPKRLFPLGLIINELITNKMKYAFIDKEAGLITISLKNVARHVTLDIRDNGNKLPAGFDMDQTKGFGLMLVKMLSQQLDGSFSMEKQAGTRCKVEFDI